MATTTTYYGMSKPSLLEAADIRVINGDIDTIDRVMHSHMVSMAPVFDPASTYDVGNLVTYNDILYRCKTAISTPAAWDSTKWDATNIVDEFPEGGGGGGGGGIDYSTIEQNTGLKWIDGSDIYQITYSFSQTPYIPSNQWTDLTETSNAGIDTVIEASILSPTGTYWDAFAIAVDTGTYIKVLNMRNAEITIKYLTIKYIKTSS